MVAIPRIFAFLFAVATVAACASTERIRVPEHVHVNALSLTKTRNGHVLESVVEIRPRSAPYNLDRPHPAPLAASRLERMSITIYSTSSDIVIDPLLLELAMDQVRQDWLLLKNKHTDNPLSIDLWLLTENESFWHRSKTILRDDAPLHLVFAVSLEPDKPVIDTIATAVDTLSHELYHVSRIGQPDYDALAEEVNATGWGFCSKVRFALVSGKNAVFRFYMQPVWRNTAVVEPDGLLVRMPRDAKEPVQRSQFGMAVFAQYLAALTGSDSFHTDNIDHIAALSDTCERIGSSEIRVRTR